MISVLCANAGLDKTYEVAGFQVGAFHHPRRVRTGPGGKGINVARVLRGMEQDVVVTGFAGGTVAQYIAGSLRREGITPDFVRIAEESRLCINVVDPARKTQTRLDEVGPLVTPSEVAQLRRKWTRLAESSRMLILSGSAPRGVPFDLYGDLILEAAKRKVTTILDAHDELLRDGVQAGPTVVKPNLAELSVLFNEELTVPDGVVKAGRKLLQLGVKVVLCSLGADGAIVITASHGEWWACAPRVQVVSPVGSGDAMVAGFAAASAWRLPLEDRVRWAVAAGSAAAAVLGAGIANRADAEALVPQVVVGPVSEGKPEPAEPAAEQEAEGL